MHIFQARPKYQEGGPCPNFLALFYVIVPEIGKFYPKLFIFVCFLVILSSLSSKLSSWLSLQPSKIISVFFTVIRVKLGFLSEKEDQIPRIRGMGGERSHLSLFTSIHQCTLILLNFSLVYFNLHHFSSIYFHWIWFLSIYPNLP